MRKLMVGLVIAGLALASAVGAVAATVNTVAPSQARFGQLNNRAVLGLAAADAADASGAVCTPKSPEDKSCEQPGGGSNGVANPTLPLVAGGGVVAVALAVGTGGGKPASP